jgi:hypothetical protein
MILIKKRQKEDFEAKIVKYEFHISLKTVLAIDHPGVIMVFISAFGLSW